LLPSSGQKVEAVHSKMLGITYKTIVVISHKITHNSHKILCSNQVFRLSNIKLIILVMIHVVLETTKINSLVKHISLRKLVLHR
jgi:hypothetical protein